MKIENIIKIAIKIIATLTVLVVADYFIQKQYNSFEKTYTVGTLGKTFKPYGQDFQVRYNFNFYGSRRHSFNSIGNNNFESKTYLIEVPIRKPDRSRILWDYPVPDTLKAPFEGWSEIPEFLKKKKSD